MTEEIKGENWNKIMWIHEDACLSLVFVHHYKAMPLGTYDVSVAVCGHRWPL